MSRNEEFGEPFRLAFCGCGRRFVARRTTGSGPAGWRKVYHYLLCSTYAGSGGIMCEHMRCHRVEKIEERVAEFVLGLRRDPERQAEGERPSLESGMLGRLYVSDEA